MFNIILRNPKIQSPFDVTLIDRRIFIISTISTGNEEKEENKEN